MSAHQVHRLFYEQDGILQENNCSTWKNAVSASKSKRLKTLNHINLKKR